MPTPIVRPCPDSLDCPPDEPLDNFSSESDDALDYISTVYAGTPPPLLRNWSATECGQTFVSNISQLDADQQAAAAANLCLNNKRDPNIDTFLNSPQTCCVPCPDGAESCYTVPGGLFSGLNQASADALAHQQACNLVKSNMVCFGNISGCICVGDNYLATLSATSPVVWLFTGGSLPPGLAFSGGIGLSTTFSGIPTTPGQYTFQIRGESAVGTFTTKTMTISVIQITTTTLPPYTVGTPYSFQLQASGGSGNYQWKIASGSLPNGLTMSIDGLISGTPT